MKKGGLQDVESAIFLIKSIKAILMFCGCRVLIPTSTGFIISWTRPIYIYMRNLQAAIDKKDCELIEIIHNPAKLMMCFKFTPNLGAGNFIDKSC
jgi:hypothetical protein